MVSDKQIIEAAILVFAHKPDATMTEVAKEAGVTRITVNRKFGSKTDLLQITAGYCVAKFEEVLESACSSDKTAIEKIYIILTGFSKLRNHYFFWMRSRVDDKRKNQEIFMRQLDVVEQLVIAAQNAGDIRADLPSGWVASLFDYMAIAASTSLHRGVVAERDVYKVAWDTLVNGIAPKKFF
ncbi:MAG: TetR/AcrR family transcriptional regulator [Sneathiella sp.]|nr:TetR/AcrR family transcriptional regulator [Sneathiella sp.]